MYVCMYVCMSVCLSVCLSVCMYVCMYVMYVCTASNWFHIGKSRIVLNNNGAVITKRKDFAISWKIIARTNSYTNLTKRGNPCNTEKF